MKFYHFTQSANLASIQNNGLWTGIYPFQPTANAPALVSLTSRLDPKGHGLFSGQVVYEGSPEFADLSLRFPQLVSGQRPGRSMTMHDQTEIAIELEINQKSPQLWTFGQFCSEAKPWTKSKDLFLIKAAALASADFPLNNGSHQELDERGRQYRMLARAGKLDDRGWHFHKGPVAAQCITAVLQRQANGTYL